MPYNILLVIHIAAGSVAQPRGVEPVEANGFETSRPKSLPGSTLQTSCPFDYSAIFI